MAAFVSGVLCSSTAYFRYIAASPKLTNTEAADMQNVVVPTFGAGAGICAGFSVMSVIEEAETAYWHGRLRGQLGSAVLLRARHFGAGVVGMGAVIVLGTAGAHLAQK